VIHFFLIRNLNYKSVYDNKKYLRIKTNNYIGND